MARRAQTSFGCASLRTLFVAAMCQLGCRDGVFNSPKILCQFFWVPEGSLCGPRHGTFNAKLSMLKLYP